MGVNWNQRQNDCGSASFRTSSKRCGKCVRTPSASCSAVSGCEIDAVSGIVLSHTESRAWFGRTFWLKSVIQAGSSVR